MKPLYSHRELAAQPKIARYHKGVLITRTRHASPAQLRSVQPYLNKESLGSLISSRNHEGKYESKIKQREHVRLISNA